LSTISVNKSKELPDNKAKAIGSWVSAARPRTLPLALASIILGSLLAASFGLFDVKIFSLTILTTVCLQVLSNFANDYGDTQNGADLVGRVGPARAVQSGQITQPQMLKAMAFLAILSLFFGFLLLFSAFQSFNSSEFYSFLGLGLLAILAAVTYTAGKKPYGYAGFGDLSVMIFFGLVGVIGTFYLQTKIFDFSIILPAISSGFFAATVLNINNLRDIDSDKIAGKKTIPVRYGKRFGIRYHKFSILSGILCAVIYNFLNYKSPVQFLFLLAIPIFYKIITGFGVNDTPQKIDTFLKKMALTSLLFSVLFGLGQVLA
jgi:1,4-dihydroxy-2-naphthoate polyprenyltransferase